MTPADPSLLAQLRGFVDWMRRAESDHRVRFANDDYVGDYGYANALKDARELLSAILEVKPPETPLDNELARLRAENERLRVPPPGWVRMAVVSATRPGEPIDPGYYEWVRVATVSGQVVLRPNTSAEPAAPTPDPPAETPMSELVDMIKANQARTATEYFGRIAVEGPAETPTPTFTCRARKTWNTEWHADCEWPTCGCDPYADKVIAALEESGQLAEKPRPADTPTGLAPLDRAPLIRMTQEEFDEGVCVGGYPEVTRVIRILSELDAQRQASASARREAIEECKRVARQCIMPPFTEVCYISGLERAFDALLEPRVSPRPPSGWQA